MEKTILLALATPTRRKYVRRKNLAIGAYALRVESFSRTALTQFIKIKPMQINILLIKTPCNISALWPVH